MKHKENFILFCVLLFFIAMAVVSIFWNGSGYYTRSYRPVVENSNYRARLERKAADDQSEQPRPAGFREKDIDKQQGDRFRTY